MDRRPPPLALADHTSHWGTEAAFWFVGAGATLAIFFALAQARRVEFTPPVEPPPEIARVVLPEAPPPAPEQPAQRSAPSVGTPMPFPVAVAGTADLPPSPSDSGLRIAAMRPAMGPVPEIDPQPHFALPSGLFRPQASADLSDPQRVFTAADVDQPPVVVNRIVPTISRRLYNSAKDPAVVALLLVNTSGVVENSWLLRSSGSEEFDTAMLEALRDWSFRPAVRRNRTVRCLVQQPVRVRLPADSPFSAN